MKWKHIFWFLPLILIFSICTPKKYQIYNRWDNIHFVNEQDFNVNPDTLFVMASNRIYHPDQEQIFDDDRNPDGTLHYVVVTFSKGEWRMVMKSSLYDAVKELPKRDFVVYVEGMGKTFPMDLKRASMMTVQYNVNVIQFEYPSIDPGRNVFSNFYFAYDQAFDAAPEYASFLHDLNTIKSEEPEIFAGNHLSLFHHSMGNRMLKHAVQEDLLNFADTSFFDNVILNAACVPQRNHKVWVEKINFTQHIFINFNKRDFQLNGARLITFDRMLGERFDKPLAGNATYIDFHPLVGDRHSNFLNMEGRDDILPECHEYYNLVLHGKSPNLMDSTLFAMKKVSGEYRLK